MIAAGSILASLGIGVVGDRVVSNIFSDYSKGKKIAIKYFQGNEVDSIGFNFHVPGQNPPSLEEMSKIYCCK